MCIVESYSANNLVHSSMSVFPRQWKCWLPANETDWLSWVFFPPVFFSIHFPLLKENLEKHVFYWQYKDLITSGYSYKTVLPQNIYWKLGGQSMPTILIQLWKNCENLIALTFLSGWLIKCIFFPFQWKENLTLTETQVQALALSRQASQELDVKRREAIYNDVLTKQQMVRILNAF